MNNVNAAKYFYLSVSCQFNCTQSSESQTKEAWSKTYILSSEPLELKPILMHCHAVLCEHSSDTKMITSCRFCTDLTTFFHLVFGDDHGKTNQHTLTLLATKMFFMNYGFC